MNEEQKNNYDSQKPQDKFSAPDNTSQSPEEEKSIGSLIGIIIIIAIIVIGGLYFWGKQINDAQTPEEIMNQPDPQAQSLREQGSSDDIQSIENDLEATQLNNLDAELEDIEQELANM